MIGMDIPKGFTDIVKLVMKEPAPLVKGVAIWDKFVQTALVGGGRSDAGIQLLISLLKKTKLLDLEKVSRLSGTEWSAKATAVLNKSMKKLKFDEDKIVVRNFVSELLRITASLKGSARFFTSKNIIKDIDKLTTDDEKTAELADEIAENEDIANIRQTKAILWLHSIGRGKALVPPTRQVKSFINSDIGPYYPYYEDDKYFINKAKELSAEVTKHVKGATAFDVSRAIFYYGSVKSMVPRGFGRAFTPLRFLAFLKKKKLTIKALSAVLGNADKRYKLLEDVDKFVRS
jgi:hypothetical protein